MMDKRLKLAADIGGTFTDIVLEKGKQRWSGKVLTTSQAPEMAVLEGLQQVVKDAGFKPSDVDVFIHGPTLANNALIARQGAKRAVKTTGGFRECMRQGYEKLC